MKQRKKQESGLAHIGLIIAAILVVAALAFAGWWVWDKNQKKDADTSSQSSQSQEQKEGKTNDPTEGDEYLVITEWGVRFPLPEDLRGDVYYKAWTDMFNNQGVSFASKRLDELVGDNSCSMKSNADGTQGPGLNISLGRLDPMDPGKVTVEYYRSQHMYITKLGNIEYYYPKQTKEPPITCLTDQHEEFNEVEQSISDQLKEAFTKLEIVN